MRARHSTLIDRTNRSAYGLQFGARGGQRTGAMPSLRKNAFEMRGELIVTVHDQVSAGAQRPVEFIGELARDLNQERTIRIRRDAGDMDATCCQVNRKE